MTSTSGKEQTDGIHDTRVPRHYYCIAWLCRRDDMGNRREDGGEGQVMPWNPEHYNKKKLFPLKDHYIPGLTERIKPVEKYIDEEHWWARHKRYIDHRKEFPYHPDKNET